MIAVEAKAPVRLDLAGGTLDIWPIYLTLPPPVLTVNLALDLPARARVEPRPAGDARIRLESLDRGQVEEYASIGALRESLPASSGGLRLLARAVEAVDPEGGLTLTTEAESPAGAGLGGSSSLLVAVLGALLKSAGRRVDPAKVRPLAQDLEAWVLGGPTGYQDYYPALLGGCLAIEGAPGGVRADRIAVDRKALARRLRLVYTGAPHHSGLTNWGTTKAYLDGEETTVSALREIALRARAVRDHLVAGDLDGALAGVVAEGAVRRRMAPGITTPTIEALDEAVRGAGALGTKVMGAGGGGCVLVVLGPEADPVRLRKALATGGSREIRVRLASRGVAFRRLAS